MGGIGILCYSPTIAFAHVETGDGTYTATFTVTYKNNTYADVTRTVTYTVTYTVDGETKTVAIA